jgi:glutamate synthase domain-containing protein 3
MDAVMPGLAGERHGAQPLNARNGAGPVYVVDLATTPIRELNAELHEPTARRYEVRNPRGAHAIAAGLRHPVEVRVAGHAGLLVIEGSASMRCGISMKGVDIVVGGDVGPMSAFMAQAGRLVVCGDAGDALGESIYEARLYVRGAVGELGADCVPKPMRDEHRAELAELLAAAGLAHRPEEFRRYGSARRLYHFAAHNSY